jgi:hypothetical protein
MFIVACFEVSPLDDDGQRVASQLQPNRAFVGMAHNATSMLINYLDAGNL